MKRIMFAMSPYTSVEYERRKIEQRLLEGIEQPRCGCQVVLHWHYTSGFLNPQGVANTSIEPCGTEGCLGPEVVLPMTDRMMQTLVDRLQALNNASAK
jgi:hypothetical protein